MKFGIIVPHGYVLDVNKHRLTESGFQFDIMI